MDIRSFNAETQHQYLAQRVCFSDMIFSCEKSVIYCYKLHSLGFVNLFMKLSVCCVSSRNVRSLFKLIYLHAIFIALLCLVYYIFYRSRYKKPAVLFKARGGGGVKELGSEAARGLLVAIHAGFAATTTDIDVGLLTRLSTGHCAGVGACCPTHTDTARGNRLDVVNRDIAVTDCALLTRCRLGDLLGGLALHDGRNRSAHQRERDGLAKRRRLRLAVEPGDGRDFTLEVLVEVGHPLAVRLLEANLNGIELIDRALQFGGFGHEPVDANHSRGEDLVTTPE